jgi:hypothetical protein
MWVAIAHLFQEEKSPGAIQNLLFNTTSREESPPVPLVSQIKGVGIFYKESSPAFALWNIPLVLKHGSAKRCWF